MNNTDKENELVRYKVLDLFSGIGGFSLGLYCWVDSPDKVIV